MRILQSKTKNGVFFGIHIPNEEMERDYPTYVKIYIRLAAEDPTITNALMALEAIASELEDENDKRENRGRNVLWDLCL